MARPWLTCSLPTTGMLFSGLAGDDARAATGADVQIDRHSPLLLGVERRMAVERRQLRRQFVVARDFLHELVVFAIMIERRFAHEAAAFDAPMVLRDRERIFSAGPLSTFTLSIVLPSATTKCGFDAVRRKIGVEAIGFFAAYGRESKPGILRP